VLGEGIATIVGISFSITVVALLETDIRNAGGEWVDEDVHIDRSAENLLVSGRNYQLLNTAPVGVRAAPCGKRQRGDKRRVLACGDTQASYP
jgi:hypothetical protein